MFIVRYYYVVSCNALFKFVASHTCTPVPLRGNARFTSVFTSIEWLFQDRVPKICYEGAKAQVLSSTSLCAFVAQEICDNEKPAFAKASAG